MISYWSIFNRIVIKNAFACMRSSMRFLIVTYEGVTIICFDYPMRRFHDSERFICTNDALFINLKMFFEITFFFSLSFSVFVNRTDLSINQWLCATMIVCYWTKYRGRDTQKGYSKWCLKIKENCGKACNTNTKKNRCRKCISIRLWKLIWFLWEAAQPNKMSHFSCLIRQKDTNEHIVSTNRFIRPLHLVHS